jgi:hypothetical protein
MIWRITIATVLAPLAASFCVGLVFGLYWAVVAGFSEGFARSAFEGLGGLFAFVFFGTLFTGLFAIAFALFSQLPLIPIFHAWGRWPIWAHLIWSGATGWLAFIALLKLDQRMGVRSFSHEGLVNTLLLSGMGVLGGIGVGLCWYAIVFRAPHQT